MTIGIKTLINTQKRNHNENRNEKAQYPKMRDTCQNNHLPQEPWLQLTAEQQNLPTRWPARTKSLLPTQTRPKISENEAKRLYPWWGGAGGERLLKEKVY
jgi:hypothetical protein